MTTFIVGSKEAACDSLWTGLDGQPVQVKIRKYLYLPEAGMISENQKATVVFYCGDAAPMTLHQGLIMEMYEPSEYLELMGQLKEARPDIQLGFTHVDIAGWEVLGYQEVDVGEGIYTGGTGGGHARAKYKQTYCYRSSVTYAISLDQYSGDPVVYYNASDEGQSNIIRLGQSDVDKIADTVQSLHDSVLKEAGAMSKFIYDGCSTSADEEAPVVDMEKLEKWVEAYVASKKSSRKLIVKGVAKSIKAKRSHVAAKKKDDKEEETVAVTVVESAKSPRLRKRTLNRA